MTRLRLVGWNVQPVVMADDGENLVPVQVSGQMIPAARWQEFKDGGDELTLQHVREQIEAAETKQALDREDNFGSES